MALILPNDIEPASLADAAELQQNYDAIEAYVNTEVIQRNGSVAMTSPLLLPGAPTQTNQAATKGYVDTQVATQLSQTEGDARYVQQAGDTMTGALNGTTPTAAAHLTRKDYVDAQVATRLTQAQVDARVTAVGDPRYVNVGGDTMSGVLHAQGVIAGNDPDATGDGAELEASGHVNAKTGDAGASIALYRYGTAADDGGYFVRFFRSGNAIGSITIDDGGVRYGTSSSGKLKEQLGPADRATELVRGLGAKAYRGRFNGQTIERIFINAEDINVIAPWAVVHDPDGLQVDLSTLVPLLLAAVNQLAARVDALEAR